MPESHHQQHVAAVEPCLSAGYERMAAAADADHVAGLRHRKFHQALSGKLAVIREGYLLQGGIAAVEGYKLLHR